MNPSLDKIIMPNTFRALNYSGYRYLWLGQLGHSAAMWMEQVVRPLLILELTGSALQVGFVVALRMTPQLIFGLLAGVIADRYNKQRVLMLSQTVTLIMHLVLAVLILTKNIAVWHVFVTAFISGASMAFNQPARQSMIPCLVPVEMMLNAIALNTAAMNTMRVLGAGLAGGLLIFLDFGEIYLLNAIIFVFVIWMTSKIRLPDNPKTSGSGDACEPPGKTTILHDLLEGFRYMAANRVVLYLVGMALVLFLIGLPYQQVFIPLLALDVLKIGRSGAGWMLALTGAGALMGSLAMASVKQLPRRGLILMGLIVLFGAALALLSQSRVMVLSGLALIIAGAVATTYNSLNMSLLFEQSDRQFHGRVLSLMSLDRGFVSLGAVVAGALAEGLGPQTGLLILGLSCISVMVILFFFLPALRKIS